MFLRVAGLGICLAIGGGPVAAAAATVGGITTVVNGMTGRETIPDPVKRFGELGEFVGNKFLSITYLASLGILGADAASFRGKRGEGDGCSQLQIAQIQQVVKEAAELIPALCEKLAGDGCFPPEVCPLPTKTSTTTDSPINATNLADQVKDLFEAVKDGFEDVQDSQGDIAGDIGELAAAVTDGHEGMQKKFDEVVEDVVENIEYLVSNMTDSGGDTPEDQTILKWAGLVIATLALEEFAMYIGRRANKITRRSLMQTLWGKISCATRSRYRIPANPIEEVLKSVSNEFAKALVDGEQIKQVIGEDGKIYGVPYKVNPGDAVV